MFDEQPDGDIHGECAHEIRRLERELAAAQAKIASDAEFIKQLGDTCKAAEKEALALRAELERCVKVIEAAADAARLPSTPT